MLMQLGLSMPQQTPAAIGPAISEALGLNRVELGLLTTAIWGGMLLGMFPAGLLIDRYGERRVLPVGGLLLALFLFLAAEGRSFAPVFLLLVPAAVGAAAGSPGGTRAIAVWFGPKARGTAMGLRQTGVTAAGVLAAVILPPIALAWGWQTAFRVVAVIALITILAFARWYRDPANVPEGERPGVGFLLRHRPWLAATAFGWMFMGTLGCAVGYLAASMHDRAGLSVIAAGYTVAVLQAGGTVGRIGWGLLSDRLGGIRPVMAMAGAMSALACLAVALLQRPGTPLWLLGIAAFLLGLSAMGWNALYVAFCAKAAGPAGAATAVGAGTSIIFTGMLAVTPAFGLLADRTGSYLWSWLALAAWCAVASAFPLLGGGLRRRAPEAG
jgi:ACS family hexuronate transporter-like MFS transporter